ncbi:MAG: hypothetical protein OEZ32_11940 [Nitrospinota bacterium]|nr:hypothetical protein [Nitrospinota bacterium]
MDDVAVSLSLGLCVGSARMSAFAKEFDTHGLGSGVRALVRL